MSDSSNERMKEEVLLSKRMFYAGCLGLPWLWICNALYFRLQVFGPTKFIDYWPGNSPPTTSTTSGGEEGSDNENEESMEQQLEQQLFKAEISKWVKWSTFGSILVMSVFISWIVVFQVNKEHFGYGWFVMDETDAEKSGW